MSDSEIDQAVDQAADVLRQMLCMFDETGESGSCGVALTVLKGQPNGINNRFREDAESGFKRDPLAIAAVLENSRLLLRQRLWAFKSSRQSGLCGIDVTIYGGKPTKIIQSFNENRGIVARSRFRV